MPKIKMMFEKRNADFFHNNRKIISMGKMITNFRSKRIKKIVYKHYVLIIFLTLYLKTTIIFNF